MTDNPKVQHKPMNSLDEAKTLMRDGKGSFNERAMDNAFLLGFSLEDMFDTFYRLERKHFIISNADWNIDKAWQDAYSIRAKGKDIYIKFRVLNGSLCVDVTSFKIDERKRTPNSRRY